MTVLDRNWRCPHGRDRHRGPGRRRPGRLRGEDPAVDRRFGHPMEAVTARKAARLRRLAAALDPATARVHPAEVRIDLVGVLRPARGARRRSSTCGGWPDGARPDPWRWPWSASRVTWSRSRPTSASGVPAFTLVGLPDASLAESRDRVRAAMVEQRPALAGHEAGHGQPVAGQPAQARQRASTSPSRRRSWPRRRRCPRRVSTTPCCSASSDSTAGCGRCAACCRRCWPRRGPGSSRWSCRRRTRPRRRWCPALRVTGVRTAGRRWCAAARAARSLPDGRDAGRASRRAGAGTGTQRRRRRTGPTSPTSLGQADGPLRARGRRGRRPPPAAGRAARRGQDDARRAAARAAARRWTATAALEVTAVHSVAGLAAAPGEPLVDGRRSRRPHHTASVPALVGGGSGARPARARPRSPTAGVLFLDEAPEFAPAVLDALRQPLESGEIAVVARWRRGCASRRGSSWCSPPTRARAGSPRPRRRDRLHVHADGAAAATSAGCPGRCSTGSTCGSRCEPRTRADLRGGAARGGGHRGGRRPGRARPGSGRPPGWPARRGGSTPRCRATSCAGGGGCPGRSSARPSGCSTAGVLTARGVDRVLRVAWTLADLAGRDQPDAGDVRVALDCRGVAPVGGLTRGPARREARHGRRGRR